VLHDRAVCLIPSPTGRRITVDVRGDVHERITRNVVLVAPSFATGRHADPNAFTLRTRGVHVRLLHVEADHAQVVLKLDAEETARLVPRKRGKISRIVTIPPSTAI